LKLGRETTPPLHEPVQWGVILIAAMLPVANFALHRNVGFSLWDEGYLWYCAQRALLGEVPDPTWHIYTVLRSNEREQFAEIDRLRRTDVRLVVVSDQVLDGIEERRFVNTQPLSDSFISESLTPITDVAAPPYLRLYRRPD